MRFLPVEGGFSVCSGEGSRETQPAGPIEERVDMRRRRGVFLAVS